MGSRRVATWLRAQLAALIASLGLAGSASALTPTITEYSSGLNANTNPYQIAAGPDGNLWFTDEGSTKAIGRVTPSGAITEFSSGLSATNEPAGIVPGPDGNLWFTDTTGAIGVINPTTHAITEYSMGLNPGSSPNYIAAGPDGNLWFTDIGTTKAIGRITPSGAITEFNLNANSYPEGIVTGPDGNLWFTDEGSTKAIGQFNPTTHAINEFSTGLTSANQPFTIVAAPDGNLWFTDFASRAIGQINPTTHTITEFSAGLNGGSVPVYMAAGPDGSLWFTDTGTTPAIGRITLSGAISEFSAGLAANRFPQGIALGSDGNMWFADPGNFGAPGMIGRITVPQMPGTGGTPPTGPLALTKVSQSHRRWREGNALPHIASARPPVGTTFRVTLNESARVRFVFKQRLPGRRVNGRCVAPTAKNRGKPKCTRLVGRGSLSFSVTAGAHKLRFQGRISKHKRLPIGRYTVVITATSSAGQHATAKLTFTIVKG